MNDIQNFSLVWKSCNSRKKNETSSTTLESFNFPLFPSVTYPELEIWKSSSKNQGKKGEGWGLQRKEKGKWWKKSKLFSKRIEKRKMKKFTIYFKPDRNVKIWRVYLNLFSSQGYQTFLSLTNKFNMWQLFSAVFSQVCCCVSDIRKVSNAWKPLHQTSLN